MATTADADLILKLYDLRRESVMRRARLFVTFEFQPETFDDFKAVAFGSSGDEAAYFRQVVSYWEMAASFVLRGAVDADLYFDSQGEGLFIYGKYSAFHGEIAATMGRPFMPQTALLLEKFPAVRERYERILAMQAAWSASKG